MFHPWLIIFTCIHLLWSPPFWIKLQLYHLSADSHPKCISVLHTFASFAIYFSFSFSFWISENFFPINLSNIWHLPHWYKKAALTCCIFWPHSLCNLTTFCSLRNLVSLPYHFLNLKCVVKSISMHNALNKAKAYQGDTGALPRNMR